MKSTFLLLIALFLTVLTYGQEQEKDFEKKNYYELEGRANFYEVNNRYNIFKDTLFYSLTGFLVNTDWDEVSIENKIYIILTYPKYKNGRQSSPERSNVENLVIDSNSVRFPIANINNKILCISKEEFEKISKKPLYSVALTK